MREFETRGDMYEWLGKELPDAKVAEIGVWQGDNASEILKRANPAKLVLVDHWKKTNDHTNGEMNVHPIDYIESRYRMVVRRYIYERRAVIMRMTSDDFIDMMRIGYYDWIYLDASHTFEFVFDQLMALHGHVNRDGYVCGHDYRSDRHPGVTKAVDKMIEDSRYEMVALTTEHPQSYALRALY